MEAALRTAYYLLKKENPPADAFKAVRSSAFQANDGVAEANFMFRYADAPYGVMYVPYGKEAPQKILRTSAEYPDFHGRNGLPHFRP